MKDAKLVWIIPLGLALLGGAGWYGQQISRAPRPKPIATVAKPDLHTLDAQAAPLLAAVAAHPAALAPRWNLAAFYGNTGQTDKAAAQIDAIDRLHPKDVSSRLALGNTRMLLRQYDRAEQDYRRVLVKNPRQVTASQGLAAALYHQRRYFEAMQAARHAVNLAPKDAGGHLILASAALQYALQFPKASSHANELTLAQSEYRALLHTFPNNGDIFYHLGQAAVGLQQANEAVKNFQKALQLAPRAEIYRDAAKAYVQMGNHPTAQKVAEEGLARFPDDALLHDLRGEMLQTSAAPDADTQALAEFQKAARLQPGNAAYQSDLGTASLRTGNLPAAQAAFETAARLKPERVANYEQLAAIYTRQGDPKRASEAAQSAKAMLFNNQQLQQIQSLLVVHPDSVPLHLIMADRFRDLHLPNPARDEYLLVLRLDPQNARAKQGLAAMTTKAATSPPLPG